MKARTLFCGWASGKCIGKFIVPIRPHPSQNQRVDPSQSKRPVQGVSPLPGPARQGSFRRRLSMYGLYVSIIIKPF